jgi:hypothetical protein
MVNADRPRFSPSPRHALIISVAIGALALGAASLPSQRARARGEALFSGRPGLLGTIAGHDLALPAEASRCSNCHAVRARAPAASPAPEPGVLPDQTAGPDLGRARLLAARSRRNGPASSFDLDSFCRLLRSGVDPASVMISRVMPRYSIGEAECKALWLYLTFE